MKALNEIKVIKEQLSTDSGLVVKFNKLGARIASLEWNGVQIAVNGYIVGRSVNRIANASFILNGKTYYLDKNDKHHLHGGSKGFDKLDWTLKEQSENKITYFLRSPDGDMGYPGNLDVSVTYTLKQSGELTVEYRAKSDVDTLLNLTNHLYMSLNGENNTNNHTLWIDADNYTEKDADIIPTGRILSLRGKEIDFKEAKTINPSFVHDDNYVLNGTGYRKVASLLGEKSGVKVDVYTDRPGLQLYNTISHISLEAQLFPDAIHHEHFPSPILKANQEFYSKTSYCFTKVK